MNGKDYQIRQSRILRVLTGILLLISSFGGAPECLAASKKNTKKNESNTIPPAIKPIISDLKKLIKDYYPRAKISADSKSLEVKFKVKTAISVYTKRPELMPKDGGLYCQIKLKPGEYRGRARLGAEVVQFYYEQITLAPYSKAHNQHLYAKIAYSADAPTNFKTRFKEIVRRFGDQKNPSAAQTKSSSKPEVRTSKKTQTAKSTTEKPANPASRDDEKLFLWKATKGDDTVWLLGTIHVAKKNFYPLPEEILDAFSKSNHLLVEVDITDPKIVKEMRASRKKVSGIYKPPLRLRDRLSPKTKKVFEDYLAWAGESWEMYDRFKPWLATDVLSGSIPRRGELAKFSGRYGIDLFLLKEAKRNDMSVSSLESTDRQFFAKLPEKVAETRLLVLLLELKNTAEDIEKIFDIWKSGDLEGMEEIDRAKERQFPLLREYHKVLLDDRNLLMVSKLIELMKEKSGPHFVAVGSAHMTGETGLVEQLKKKGFSVNQVHKSRPELPGLYVVDVSGKYKFADGPMLKWRKELYNEIQALAKKDIGVTGYMNSFEWLEDKVKSGTTASAVKKEVRRIETAMSKQLDRLAPQIITPYCIELESRLGGIFKSTDGLEKNCILACTVDDGGKLTELKASEKNNCKAEVIEKSIAAVKSFGTFPKPPKAPLKLNINVSSDPSSVEVWYRGVIDYTAFMKNMRTKIKRKWKPHHSKTRLLSVSYKIFRDGHVEDVAIESTSGSPEIDEDAKLAIEHAAPFAKLPDGSKKSIEINFKFLLRAN